MKYGETLNIIISYGDTELTIDSSTNGNYRWYSQVWIERFWEEEMYFMLFRAMIIWPNMEQMKAMKWLADNMSTHVRQVNGFMDMKWWNVTFDIFIPLGWKYGLSHQDKQKLHLFALLIKSLIVNHLLLDLNASSVMVWTSNFMFNVIFGRNENMVDRYESPPIHLSKLQDFERGWRVGLRDFPVISNVVGSLWTLIKTSAYESGNEEFIEDLEDVRFEHNFVNSFPRYWCCDETMEKFGSVCVECLCHFR